MAAVMPDSRERHYSRLDQAFAGFLGARCRLDPVLRQRFMELVRELCRAQHNGHSCIRLDAQHRDIVRASGMAADGRVMPLVLEEDRLYLQRYWHYETRLARQLRAMAARRAAVAVGAAPLDRYFPPVADATDWQREAARCALRQGLSMITGGPGTGKTSTVVKILALLQEFAPRPLHIALAAPTGKAAMRLQEAIGLSKARLPCSEAVRQHIPESVTTIHRLLGARPPSPFFRHSAETPLPHDLVVIDEASMVDLALMSKLVDALKKDARLILLGDKDQLASVESGAVLADLTAALPAHTLELRKSFRFEENIKNLADSVNLQQPEQAWRQLLAGGKNITLLTEKIVEEIVLQQTGYLQRIRQGCDYGAIYRSFSAFQVLCATRQGRFGVESVNLQVRQRLAEQRLIDPEAQWYSGRPVMITQNDANMHLYNGDIGICLPDQEQGDKLMVFFQRPDGSVKKYLPARLPHCETVFAMTIHKSQGSEFDRVLIMLPEKMNPVLTKELLYTAITRARKMVTLVADADVFARTVNSRVERYGVLAQKLRAAARLAPGDAGIS